MRATMTLGLAVLLAVPLLAGDAAFDELVIEAKEHVHDYSLTPPDSIGGVIESALPAGSAGELFAIVRERFGLKEETARLITIAVLRNLVADGGANAETGEERIEILRTLDREYGAALRSDPSNAAVAREYLALLADGDNGFSDAGKRVCDVLRGLPRDQRGLVSLQVLSDFRVRNGDAALFEAVTDSYGFNPLALAIAGDELTSSGNAELFDRAATLWLAQKDVESASAAASRAIYAFANRRSLADVLRIYRCLPAEGRAMVSSAPAAEATVRSRGVERRIGTRDIRFTLAAAFILSGDARAALPLLPASQPKKDDAEGQSNAAMTAMLLAAIDSPGGDAFDLVTDYLQRTDARTTALVDEVFDRVAARAGYAASSKWRLDTVTRADEQLANTERMALPSAAAALLPATAVRTDAISPGVARLLNRAPLVPFVECTVDVNARSADPGGLINLRGTGFPPGLDVLRSETRGDEAVALASSQNVDPAGDSSAGGYWIVRSTDGGATWNPPLYTGLRVAQPYEAVLGSTLPMLRDDGVRVDVTTTGTDGRTQQGIAVDLKWRDLERDTDRDGLTDLMEERILTDPNSVDTDGDGLPDGADSLPQVAFRQSAGDTTAIIAAVFDAYYGSDIAENAARLDIGGRTIFLTGNPADFAGLKSRLRIIVMSDAEIDAVSKKFGPIVATHISPVIVDQTGTRAWVQLNDAGNGATFRLEKGDGIWTAQVVASATSERLPIV
jgi:hypothetical protein